MKCPRAVVFDLDDTLVESFQPLTEEMAERLVRLTTSTSVVIMSAGSFPRIERNVLSILTPRLRDPRFYVFTNNAAELYSLQNNAWKRIYQFALSAAERADIAKAIEEAVEKTGIRATLAHDRYIQEREANMVFLALPLNASAEEKKSWDVDSSKRMRLKIALDQALPEFEIAIGGPITINITRKNINKAYGVQWLVQELNVPTDEMLFIGDALYPGGNDAVVIPTGIETRQVSGPKETMQIIEELLVACKS